MSEETKKSFIFDSIKAYLEIGETGYEILKRLKKSEIDTTGLALVTRIPLFILISKLSQLEKKGLLKFKKIEKLGEKLYSLTKKGKETLRRLK